MKIKVAELEGAKLDYWAGVAEGLLVEIKSGACFRETSFGKHEYRPSSDWSQGGPIIERERITVEPSIDVPDNWAAAISNDSKQIWIWKHGRTPLIAAMRTFVYSKFGKEVEG